MILKHIKSVSKNGWMYEKNFGQKKLKAYDVNEKRIKLDTASQLYDFLIKEMKSDD